MADAFLLTKAPGEPRSNLCFKVMKHSKNPRLYLAGDGIYHLLKMSGLPARKTLACREDILARGVPLPRPDSITMPDDFYGQLVKDIMENPDKIYVF